MDPAWQKYKCIEVKALPTGIWNLVSSYIPGSRLLRFTVVNRDANGDPVLTTWDTGTGTNCSADGIITSPPKSGLLSTGTLFGSLVGKLGGSSADVPDSSAPTAPYGTKRVFGVGSHCVISLASTESGPLYLTMNDSPDGFASHSGSLQVLIEQYAV
jgi:hypothetical protein